MNGGIGFFGALALVFIVLKLIGTIAWSWWWVLAPLWGPMALALGISAFIAAFLAAVMAWEALRK